MHGGLRTAIAVVLPSRQALLSQCNISQLLVYLQFFRKRVPRLLGLHGKRLADFALFALLSGTIGFVG